MRGDNWLYYYATETPTAIEILKRYNRQAVELGANKLALFYCSAKQRWQHLEGCVVCQYFDVNCLHIAPASKELAGKLAVVWENTIKQVKENKAMAKIIKKKADKSTEVTGKVAIAKKSKATSGATDNDTLQLFSKVVKDIVPDYSSEFDAINKAIASLASDVKTALIGLGKLKELVSGMSDIEIHHTKKASESRQAQAVSVAGVKGDKAIVAGLFVESAEVYNTKHYLEACRDAGATVQDTTLHDYVKVAKSHNIPVEFSIVEYDGDTYYLNSAYYTDDAGELDTDAVIEAIEEKYYD